MSAPRRAFKGNTAARPTKACAHCGRPMCWRNASAKNRDKVEYCSDACRRGKVPRAAAGEPAR